ncbi:hypothetical protein D039_3443B, partial [Vibrio parahaemolyticus EKP-028]
TSMTLA